MAPNPLTPVEVSGWEIKHAVIMVTSAVTPVGGNPFNPVNLLTSLLI